MNFIKEFLKVWFPIILLIIGAFWLTSKFIKPAPDKHIVIAAGKPEGVYYKYALKYKVLLEKEKMQVEIISTAGSVEIAELLKNKKADIGFIQGGTADEKSKETLHSLASIYFEPLWIFYNNDINQTNYIYELDNRRMSIGEEGSGTKALSEKLLEINNIVETNETQIFNYSTAKSYEELKNGNIDAFFSVISPQSEIIQTLLKDKNVTLMDIQRTKAYAQKFDFLTGLQIPEGSIDIKENIPNHNIHLLSTVATLVVRDDFSDELIRLFMKQVKQVHNKQGMFEEDGIFPSQKYLEIPIHEEAEKYLETGDTFLEKIFPFWIASNIDRFKIFIIPVLTLLIPLSKGFFPLYTWRMRSQIYKWYKQLNTIDKELLNYQKHEIEEKIGELQLLQEDIRKETKVPLSFMGEYYNLQLHLDLLIDKLYQRLHH